MKKQFTRYSLLLFLLVCTVSNFAFAQQGQITGTVTESDSGVGIPGVSVLVKGTTQGAITDLDGNYNRSRCK